MAEQARSHALEALAVLQSYFSGDVEAGTALRPARARQLYAKLAHEQLALRELRREAFGQELSNDHCWELIITMYLAACSDIQLSVMDIAHTTGVPAATTVRWLNVLTANDLLIRTADVSDGRRTWVSLKPSLIKRLDTYFERQLSGNFGKNLKWARAA